MRKLTIYRRYFTKNDCYKGAYKQNSCAIQVHSTGANNPWLHRYVQPDDGRIGKNKYGNDSNRSGTTVCASAYIGKQTDGTVAVYQTLPWNYRCWLSGSAMNGNANKLGYVGFEICEDAKTDKDYFQKAVMEVSVNLTAYLCQMFGTNPYAVIKQYAQGNALAVMDHQELHSLKLASNHADIRHWLKLYGLTMNDYRAAVQKAMDEGVEVTYIDCDDGSSETEVPVVIDKNAPALYEADVTCTGTYLNIRQAKSTSSASVCQMKRGSVCEVLDDSDPDWWIVRQGSIVGYSMPHNGSTKWLQKRQEVPAQPASTWTVTITGLDQKTAESLLERYGGNAVRET